jgi:NADPH-dependent 2,4-dienoyl-CoA reductase/sulfur reductase-like enzyme
MSERAVSFEIVVVGGGPAGLAAACAAAESGHQVTLVDETPWLGGQIWRGQSPRPTLPEARGWFDRFHRSGATLFPGTAVVAAPEPGLLLAERDDRPCQFRWQRLILATGARELFLPFPGWTLPGVMGPGGLQALVKNGWPISGQRVLLAGSGPLLLAVANSLRRQGACVLSVVEQAPRTRVLNFGLGLYAHPAKLWQGLRLKLRLLGIPYHCGAWPLRAEGDGTVRAVTLTNGKQTWSEECDLFACGFGLVPNVELPLALGCQLAGGSVRVDGWQATTVPNVFCAGEPTGIGGADCALVEGQIAGYAAADASAQAEALFARRAAWHQFRAALAHAFALRSELKSIATNDTLVCRCEDITLGQMRRFSSWRDAKLQSRCGMGSCQGRVCGAAAKVLLGWGMESVRPPILPARVTSLVSQTNPRPEPDARTPSPHAQSEPARPLDSRLQPR